MLHESSLHQNILDVALIDLIHNVNSRNNMPEGKHTFAIYYNLPMSGMYAGWESKALFISCCIPSTQITFDNIFFMLIVP